MHLVDMRLHEAFLHPVFISPDQLHSHVTVLKIFSFEFNLELFLQLFNVFSFRSNELPNVFWQYHKFWFFLSLTFNPCLFELPFLLVSPVAKLFKLILERVYDFDHVHCQLDVLDFPHDADCVLVIQHFGCDPCLRLLPDLLVSLFSELRIDPDV